LLSENTKVHAPPGALKPSIFGRLVIPSGAIVKRRQSGPSPERSLPGLLVGEHVTCYRLEIA
jgi:hypothetical protein